MTRPYHRMKPEERAKRDARIVELADSGLTISQLRERFGLTNQHIQSVLRKSGRKDADYDTFNYAG